MSVACHNALARLSSEPRAIASSRSCRSDFAPFISIPQFLVVFGGPSRPSGRDAEFLWKTTLEMKRANPVKPADQFCRLKFIQMRGNGLTGAQRLRRGGVRH